MLDKTVRELVHAVWPWAVIIAWAVFILATAAALRMDGVPAFARIVLGLVLLLEMGLGLSIIL